MLQLLEMCSGAGRGGPTKKVRIVLALKERVEIRCSEESSDGPESRGDSLVIQCLGNNNNRNQYNQRE